MSQHDLDIANATRTAVRGDINDAIEALATRQSGASAPPTTFPHMPWADTTNMVLKRRNASDTGWVIEGPLAPAPMVTRSSNSILTQADHGTTIHATGTFTQTISAASALSNGWSVNYVNAGTGVITLDANSTELIEGTQLLRLVAGQAVSIQCNGSGFKILNWRYELCDALAFGADPSDTADSAAAFTAAGSVRANYELNIPPGTFKLSSTPTPSQTGGIYVMRNGASLSGAAYLPVGVGLIKNGGMTEPWVTALYTGIFDYMGQNAAFNVRARAGGLGIHSAVRSSTGSGAAGEANIGYSAFGYADYISGSEGTWGYYASMLRKAGNTGVLHGMEIDIGNLGSNVEIYPSAMFPAGNNNALWLASGGESAAASPPATLNSASCAVGIISNDPLNNARFLKGIVFHNKAIAGVEGDGVGRGAALALSPGHSFIYFNNSNQAVGEYSCTNTDIAKGLYMDLSPFGLLLWDRQAGKEVFQVGGVASGVNYFYMANAVTGAPVEIQAKGDDGHIDIYLKTKGANGRLRFGTFASGSDVACNGTIEIKDSSGVTRKLMITA